ncbi:Transcriptional regulator, IclR family [Candidatus Paraburkholderia schumanniana]|nr:Transcriptional regulator, IclR family [Candidatus Paraburkholderia schumannianae]
MLVEASRDGMMQLSRATQESVGLVVAVNDQVICLEMIESTHSLRCSFEKGRAVPLRAGASAKSLLAFMADKTRAETLERQFAGDDAVRAAFEAELERIRARGYAMSDSEVDPGVWGVSAPVFRRGHERNDHADGAVLARGGPRTAARRLDRTHRQHHFRPAAIRMNPTQRLTTPSGAHTMKLKNLLSAASLGIAMMVAALPGTARAQDSNVLNVATDATFPPMEFVDKGERTGFDIDIMNALATVMGKKIQWTDIDFKGLIPGLVAHRFDAAISGIYITPERVQVVDFTQSYFAGGLSALVKADSPIKTLADLNAKKVTVQVGTKSVNFLRDNYPQVQRVEVEKNQEMFDLVGIGRADAAVTGKPAAYQSVRTRPGFRVLDKELTTEAYGIAMRKDEPQLRDQMNAALAKIKADGTYDAIVKKWFGASASTTENAK